MSIKLKTIMGCLDAVAMMTWLIGGIAATIMISTGFSDEDLFYWFWCGLGLAVTALVQGTLLFAVGHILNLLNCINENTGDEKKTQQEPEEELPQL